MYFSIHFEYKPEDTPTGFCISWFDDIDCVLFLGEEQRLLFDKLCEKQKKFFEDEFGIDADVNYLIAYSLNVMVQRFCMITDLPGEDGAGIYFCKWRDVITA